MGDEEQAPAEAPAEEPKAEEAEAAPLEAAPAEDAPSEAAPSEAAPSEAAPSEAGTEAASQAGTEVVAEAATETQAAPQAAAEGASEAGAEEVAEGEGAEGGEAGAEAEAEGEAGAEEGAEAEGEAAAEGEGEEAQAAEEGEGGEGGEGEEAADEEERRPSDFKSSESLGKERASLREEGAKDGRKSRSERLSSKAKAVLGSTISIRRLSATGEFALSKIPRYMNSYRLESYNPFNPDRVQKILEEVMVESLENLTYDPDKCPKQAKWASSAIRGKVKDLQFDRYKLICLVTIGEKNSQDVLVTCRFLWDVDRDRYAIYSLENTYVFGIAQCFGLYYE